MFDTNGIQIRLILHLRLLTHRRPSHLLTQMGKTSQKEFVVVGIPILPPGNPPKSPPIRLPDERRKLRVLKVRRNHPNFELTGFENPPGPTVGHPSDDIREVGSGEYGVHFGWEIGDACEGCEGCERIVVGVV